MALTKPKFEVYQGSDDKWYWRLRAVNGRVIATGAEGYERQEGAEEGVFRLVGIMQAHYYEIKFPGDD
jgi:uncharacterized protein YegP (UPF0339 family)